MALDKRVRDLWVAATLSAASVRVDPHVSTARVAPRASPVRAAAGAVLAAAAGVLAVVVVVVVAAVVDAVVDVDRAG